MNNGSLIYIKQPTNLEQKYYDHIEFIWYDEMNEFIDNFCRVIDYNILTKTVLIRLGEESIYNKRFDPEKDKIFYFRPENIISEEHTTFKRIKKLKKIVK